MQTYRYALDDGQRHSLLIGVVPDGVVWIRLCHSSGDRRSRVHEALRVCLRVRAGGAERGFPQGEDRLELDTPASLVEVKLLADPPCTLATLDGRGQVGPGAYRLSHFETRFLADNGYPHPVATGDLGPAGLTTDLHTHFAGCIAPADLLRIAALHDVDWPARVLAAAGVASSALQLPTHLLSPEVLARLGASMVAPEDRQITFLEMERIYAVRGPVTKSRVALPDLCAQIAQDYRAMGVRYVELSLGPVVEEQVLSVIARTVPELEARTGVTMRFLAAMSRHDDLEWDLDYLDRLEQVLDCPYIVGVDFMGHETNSTLAFARQIGEAAARGSRRRPRFVIRVHAGENPAHPENVRLAAEAVRGHDVQLRIGHGLYGTDEISLRLLSQLEAIVEFNLNSNLALNNILASADAPLRRYIDAGVQAVLGTDGYGIYQTSMEAEARAARLAGLGEAELAWIRETEKRYVTSRLEADDRHAAKPGTFVVPPDTPARHYSSLVGDRKREAAQARRDAWAARLQALGIAHVEPSHVKALARGRTCLLFAGAWANAWRGMDARQQARVRDTITGIMDGLSADETLVVTGGTQFGVEGIAALAARKRGIDVLGVLVHDLDPSSVADGHLTGAVFVGTTLYEKAAALYGLLRALDGGVLYFGGGPIVHDEVQTASNLRLPHLLMTGAGGASARRAQLQPDLAFASVSDALRGIARWAQERPSPAPFWHTGPNPTADAVVTRMTNAGRELLLIRRHDDAPAEPGKWALPGGFVAGSSPKGLRWEPGAETASQACLRELREETGLDLLAVSDSLLLIGVYERGGRDPRDTQESWSQSTVYAIEVGGATAEAALAGGDDASEARWFPVGRLPCPLAFDHERIVGDALRLLSGG